MHCLPVLILNFQLPLDFLGVGTSLEEAKHQANLLPNAAEVPDSDTTLGSHCCVSRAPTSLGGDRALLGSAISAPHFCPQEESFVCIFNLKALMYEMEQYPPPTFTS